MSEHKHGRNRHTFDTRPEDSRTPTPIPNGPSVYIGGPAYRMHLHAGHAQMLQRIGEVAGQCGIRTWTDYCHSSILATTRCEWLARALASGADVAVTIDSDVYLDGAVLLAVAQRCADFDGCVSLLCPQTNGQPNVLLNSVVNADGEFVRPRMTADNLPRPYAPFKIWAGGTGAMVFPLKWYRSIYCAAIDPSDAFVLGPAPDAADSRPMIERWREPRVTHLGEDIHHGRTVAKAGGQPMAIYLPGIVHDSYA